jgi:hypothetical protein
MAILFFFLFLLLSILFPFSFSFFPFSLLLCCRCFVSQARARLHIQDRHLPLALRIACQGLGSGRPGRTGQSGRHGGHSQRLRNRAEGCGQARRGEQAALRDEGQVRHHVDRPRPIFVLIACACPTKTLRDARRPSNSLHAPDTECTYHETVVADRGN